jgi:hypothetical protein
VINEAGTSTPTRWWTACISPAGSQPTSGCLSSCCTDVVVSASCRWGQARQLFRLRSTRKSFQLGCIAGEGALRGTRLGRVGGVEVVRVKTARSYRLRCTRDLRSQLAYPLGPVRIGRFVGSISLPAAGAWYFCRTPCSVQGADPQPVREPWPPHHVVARCQTRRPGTQVSRPGGSVHECIEYRSLGGCQRRHHLG